MLEQILLSPFGHHSFHRAQTMRYFGALSLKKNKQTKEKKKSHEKPMLSSSLCSLKFKWEFGRGQEGERVHLDSLVPKPNPGIAVREERAKAVAEEQG